MNCWKPTVKTTVISSQASQEEGSTAIHDSGVGASVPKRPAPEMGDDMVCSRTERADGEVTRPDNDRLYVSSFGELTVVLDRHMDNCWFLLDFNYLATPVLRTTSDWPLAKVGDSERRQVLRESTFAVLNSESCGMLDGLEATLPFT